MGNDNTNNSSNEAASEAMQKKAHEIAQRIYNLDKDVYIASGSSLGRAFNNGEARDVEDLYRLILTNPQGYRLRSEIALVGNMARTITTKDEKKRLMKEYNSLLNAIHELPRSFGSVDIKDEVLANLNSSNFGHKMSENDHLIVCISRTEGSAGTDIGFALADQLRVNYYDAEVLKDVLKKVDDEKDAEVTGKTAPKDSKVRQFSRYHGLNKSDAVFFNESEILCNLAREEDFVVMGRCADSVLTNNRIPHISVFITAPFEMRARRIMELEGITYKQAAKRLAKRDTAREHFYRFYTGKIWGNASNYDLCINSASYGIQESVDLILRILNKEAKKNN
jgi:cytidylate kinase